MFGAPRFRFGFPRKIRAIPPRRSGAFGWLTAFMAICLLIQPAATLAQDSGQATGRIAYLRVQGSSEAQQGPDVVIRLEGQGDQQFGFALTGLNQQSHLAMFDLIREAYFNEHEIGISYLVSGNTPVYEITSVWLPANAPGETVLPTILPEATGLEFVIPEERFDGNPLFPPEIVGATDVEIIPIPELSTFLAAADRQDLIRVALNDDRVRESLGERFEAVMVEQLPLDIEGKTVPEFLEGTRFASGVLIEALTFFSYSNNIVVRTFLQEDHVLSVERAEPSFYQPPETASEVQRAIELARGELGDRVAELTGHAILAYPPLDESDAAFYDRRILYVTFFAREDEGPLFTALVDLTEDRVLSAGPVD